MSTTRPDSPGWEATGATLEPDSSKKTAGFVAGDVPPAKAFNWFWALVSTWFTWATERFADGTSSADLVIRAPQQEGGALALRAGSSAGGVDQDGGDAILSGGTTTGAAGSKASLYAAPAGASGSGLNAAETYLDADGDSDTLIAYKEIQVDSAVSFVVPIGVHHGMFTDSSSHIAREADLADASFVGHAHGAANLALDSSPSISAAYFIVPLILPKGAVITQVDGLFARGSVGVDNDDVYLELVRVDSQRSDLTTAPTTVASAGPVTVNTESTAGGQTVSLSGIASNNEVSERYLFHVRAAYLEGAVDKQVGFYGVRVTYQPGNITGLVH